MHSSAALRRILGVTVLVTLVLPSVLPAAQQLPSLLKVGEIGAFQEPEEEVFAEISDVAVGDNGTIFILDGVSHEIRAFGSDGAFLASAGRYGKGPGEFTGARAIAVDESGTLYVLDERLARVSMLRLNDSLSYERSLLISHHATDICVLDDRLYLVGNHEDGIIQRFSLDGTYLGSHGSLYEGANPILQASLNQGFMLCVAEADLIIAASPVFPLVRAYDSEGESVWSVELPGFRETIFEENLDGSVTFTVGSDKQYHVLESVLYFPPGLVLVQGGLSTLGSSPAGAYDAIHTWVLSAEDGSLISRTDSLPLLRHIGRERAHGVTADPYPKLTVFRVAGREGA